MMPQAGLMHFPESPWPPLLLIAGFASALGNCPNGLNVAPRARSAQRSGCPGDAAISTGGSRGVGLVRSPCHPRAAHGEDFAEEEGRCRC
eukprot:1915974-Alexandrium_andersonii.AAC.1